MKQLSHSNKFLFHQKFFLFLHPSNILITTFTKHTFRLNIRSNLSSVYNNTHWHNRENITIYAFIFYPSFKQFSRVRVSSSVFRMPLNLSPGFNIQPCRGERNTHELLLLQGCLSITVNTRSWLASVINPRGHIYLSPFLDPPSKQNVLCKGSVRIIL